MEGSADRDREVNDVHLIGLEERASVLREYGDRELQRANGNGRCLLVVVELRDCLDRISVTVSRASVSLWSFF